MQDDNRRGIAFMILAMASLITNDMLMKLAAQDIPVGQTMFLRGLVVIPVLLLAAWHMGAWNKIRDAFHPTVMARTTGEVGFNALYLTGLAHLPIANANAILQLVPLLSTATAAFLLGELVGIRRWIAITVGFLGVLLVIRPGVDGFNGWTIFILVSTLFATLRDLSSRRLPKGTTTVFVSFVSAVAVLLLSLVMGLFEDWDLGSITPDALLYSGAAGLVLAVACFPIIRAMPVPYTQLTLPARHRVAIPRAVWYI